MNPSSPYSARYLVLLPTPCTQSALLFNGRHDFLATLDDDGFVLVDLVRACTPCALPSALPLPTIDGGREIRCYALG